MVAAACVMPGLGYVIKRLPTSSGQRNASPPVNFLSISAVTRTRPYVWLMILSHTWLYGIAYIRIESCLKLSCQKANQKTDEISHSVLFYALAQTIIRYFRCLKRRKSRCLFVRQVKIGFVRIEG